jgi:hypothetical protein
VTKRGMWNTKGSDSIGTCAGQVARGRLDARLTSFEPVLAELLIIHSRFCPKREHVR